MEVVAVDKFVNKEDAGRFVEMLGKLLKGCEELRELKVFAYERDEEEEEEEEEEKEVTKKERRFIESRNHYRMEEGEAADSLWWEVLFEHLKNKSKLNTLSLNFDSSVNFQDISPIDSIISYTGPPICAYGQDKIFPSLKNMKLIEDLIDSEDLYDIMSDPHLPTLSSLEIGWRIGCETLRFLLSKCLSLEYGLFQIKLEDDYSGSASPSLLGDVRARVKPSRNSPLSANDAARIRHLQLTLVVDEQGTFYPQVVPLWELVRGLERNIELLEVVFDRSEFLLTQRQELETLFEDLIGEIRFSEIRQI